MRNWSLIAFVKKLVKHPLLAGSLVMVVGSNIYNFGQFAYHFITARLLEQTYGASFGKAFYGDIAAMLSIMGVIGIVQLALGLTVVKFVAGSKNELEVANFTKWFLYWTFWIALGVLVVTIILSPFLSSFLNLTNKNAIYLLAPALFFFMLISSGRSVLQGSLRFGQFIASLLAEVGAKIVFTVSFILLGFAVFGIMTAILGGVFFAFVLTFYFLKDRLRKKWQKRPELAPLLKYSFPVFAQGLALTSMYSTDLMLVKHFFSPVEAGLYAALVILGRVVFFAASPIMHVMFPLVVRRYTHGGAYHNIFYLSLLLIGGLVALLIAFYYLFPQFPIGILYGSTYLEGAGLLWMTGLFMGLLAVSTLFVQFYLSIGKTKTVWLFVFAAVLQAVLIWFNHGSLREVIQISILTSALLLFTLLVYFPYHHRPSPARKS